MAGFGFEKIIFLTAKAIHREGNPVKAGGIYGAVLIGYRFTEFRNRQNANVGIFWESPNTLCLTSNTTEVVNCLTSADLPVPECLVDIGVEARNLRNGLVEKDDCSLDNALA